MAARVIVFPLFVSSLVISGRGLAWTSGEPGVGFGPPMFDRADVLFAGLALATAALVFAGLSSSRRRSIVPLVREMVSWLLLFAALGAGYTFREDLLALGARAVAEIAPPGSLAARLDTEPQGERAVRIRRRSDGHFIARTSLNGQTLAMLVDTGASMVVLRPSDAVKLGINPAKLHYSVPVQTANGTTFAAPVRLKNVAVGPIVFAEIDALVAKPGTLRDSLLGMSFLNRLRSYEFSGDFLTLRI